MAVVECGLCGWTREIDEALPEDLLEVRAVKVYAEHMLDWHPDAARSDAVVRVYIARVGQIIAPTNGTAFRKRG